MTPLHAAIQVSALQMQDMNGNPLIGLSAVFRKSSNISAPPSAGSDLDALEVQAAITGVRYCLSCQDAMDKDPRVAGYNRRGSKDSQLR